MLNIGKVEVSLNILVLIILKEFELGGNIDILWVRIEVEELLESVVSVSDDEVIMDGLMKKKIFLR